MRDLYEILGFHNNDSEQDIKKAYRKLALKNHPDRNPGNKDPEEKFKSAAEAYAVLSNSQKRSRYDQFGHAGVGMGDSAGSGGFSGGGVHMSMDDIFSQFGDIFGGSGGSPFESFFGGNNNSAKRTGSDIRIKLKLTLSEIAKGIDKKIKIKRSVLADGVNFKACPTCNGAGQVTSVQNTILGQMRSSSLCPHCEGSGKRISNRPPGSGPDGMIRKDELVVVKVPAGVEDGNYMTVKNKGNENLNGVAGDLIVLFSEENHPFFTRDGENIYIEAIISYPQAVLGSKIEIPTIDGKVDLKIPPGIQSNQILRMKRKGLPVLRGNYTGDQLVKIHVETPTKVSKECERILLELDKNLRSVKNPFRKIDM